MTLDVACSEKFLHARVCEESCQKTRHHPSTRHHRVPGANRWTISRKVPRGWASSVALGRRTNPTKGTGSRFYSRCTAPPRCIRFASAADSGRPAPFPNPRALERREHRSTATPRERPRLQLPSATSYEVACPWSSLRRYRPSVARTRVSLAICGASAVTSAAYSSRLVAKRAGNARVTLEFRHGDVPFGLAVARDDGKPGTERPWQHAVDCSCRWCTEGRC